MARLYSRKSTENKLKFTARLKAQDSRLETEGKKHNLPHFLLLGSWVLALALCPLLFVSYSYCDTPASVTAPVEVNPVQEADSVGLQQAAAVTASTSGRPAIVEAIKPVYLPKTTKLEIMSDSALKIKQVKLSAGGVLLIDLFNATTSLPASISIDKAVLRGVAFETEAEELKIYISLTEPVIYEVENTDHGLVAVFQNPVLEQLVSLNINNESLSTVLLMLFTQYGANIVAGSGVTGTVTAHLVDVPLKEALDEILKAEGFGYEEEGGLIRVMRAADIEKKQSVEASAKVPKAALETETKFFDLKYIAVAEVEQVLQKLIGTEGTIIPSKQTNSIIIVSTPEQVKRIGEIIAQLDRKPPDVEEGAEPTWKAKEETKKPEQPEVIVAQIVKKVFQLDYISPTQASAILQPLLSEQGTIEIIEKMEKEGSGASGGASGGISGAAGSGMQLGESVGQGGYLVVSDTKDIIEAIEKEIDKLDVPIPQVEIEAYIVEGTLSDDSELGVNWTVVSKEDEAELSFSGDLGAVITKGIISAEKFVGILNALSNRSDLRVLSNPRITTLENQPAVFHSGDKVPYNRITIQEGIQQVETVFEDVGILLTVTPQVKEGGIVSLLLSTSVSSEGGFTPSGQPRIATRTTQSQVLVKSNDTVAIAGLISEKTSIAVSKVPIVGDIPLVGRVFSTEREVKQRSEVTIFITPRIVKAQVPEGVSL